MLTFYSTAVTRVGGNKKGIFTRQRQPKEAAHYVRKRYFTLAQNMENSTVPDDLFAYVFENIPSNRLNGDNELK